MSCELCVETHWEVGLGMFMMQLGKEINIIAKPAHVCFFVQNRSRATAVLYLC